MFTFKFVRVPDMDMFLSDKIKCGQTLMEMHLLKKKKGHANGLMSCDIPSLSFFGNIVNRHQWTEDKVQTFLNLIYKKNITVLDGNLKQNACTYQEVRVTMSSKVYDNLWTTIRNK